MNLSKIFVALACAICVLCATACSDDDFRMSTTFINSDTYAIFTDETQLQLATFKLDSVQTSGQNIIWVGKAHKPVIGDIFSESYIRLAEPTRVGQSSGYLWAQNGKEVYDSVCVVLRHTGSYEGDTMKTINIEVRRMAEKIEFAEGLESSNETFYNVRSFRDSTKIGSYSFTPRPHTRPRIRFRLDDSFGQDLVSFIKSSVSYDSKVVSQMYDKFLGGVKIICGDTANAEALLAFRTDSFKIELHSHLRGLQDIHQIRVFSPKSLNLQFNHVWNENVETPFNQLEHRYQSVSEDETDEKSVLFEGLGYYTRVNFPSLEYLHTMSGYYGHVVKATLKLYPLRDSYDKRRIPSTFYLTEINKGNVIQNYIYTSTSKRVAATLVYNTLDEDEVYYAADVTYFLNTILTSSVVDENLGILITWGTSMSPVDYNFMVFNGHGLQQYRSELEVTYYNYDREY